MDTQEHAGSLPDHMESIARSAELMASAFERLAVAQESLVEEVKKAGKLLDIMETAGTSGFEQFLRDLEKAGEIVTTGQAGAAAPVASTAAAVAHELDDPDFAHHPVVADHLKHTFDHAAGPVSWDDLASGISAEFHTLLHASVQRLLGNGFLKAVADDLLAKA